MRGLAAAVVWVVLAELFVAKPDAYEWDHDAAAGLITSLMDIPISYEKHGTGTIEEATVATLASQNMAAQVQPVSAIHWVTMVRLCMGITSGQPVRSRAELKVFLAKVVHSYQERPDVKAYDVQLTDGPPAKKAKKIADAEGEDRGICIGNKKLRAVSNILSGASMRWFQMATEHLQSYEYRYSVFSDEFLNFTFIWPGSAPVKLCADNAFSESSFFEVLPLPGQAYVAMEWEKPLTERESEAVLKKLILNFEREADDENPNEANKKLRPNIEQANAARHIVQFWGVPEQGGGAREVAKAVLPEDDFEELDEAILTHFLYDAATMAVCHKRPKIFTASQFAPLAGKVAESRTDDTATLLEREFLVAQQQVAQSRLLEFKAALKKDQAQIDEMEAGAAQLRDFLEWHTDMHIERQCAEANMLAMQYIQKTFTFVKVSKIEVDTLGNFSPEWSGICQKYAHRAVIMEIDINKPTGRDIARLAKMLTVVSTMLKFLGNEGILLIWMPDIPKENSNQSLDEEEKDPRGL